jgi:two-component system, response regulator / RNA-binding antiterminator
MSREGMSEEEAYQTIRRQAMSKRIPMEDLATAIINANGLLKARPRS